MLFYELFFFFAVTVPKLYFTSLSIDRLDSEYSLWCHDPVYIKGSPEMSPQNVASHIDPYFQIAQNVCFLGSVTH